MRVLLALPLVLSLLECGRDETLSGYGADGKTWVLEEIDGQSFPASATISFPEEGRIVGKAPCNTYFAAQLQPYPWFEADQLGTTRRACPDLAQETAFLNALSEMTLAEVTENTLILSTPEGRAMIFRAAD